jgi:glycosyltransferase involved in cell wall biosynthesis
MDAPALTVLMPVRAYSDEFLGEAIGALLAQTDPRWRLLVIRDDRDVDEFAQKHRELLADPRIELIQNEGRKLAGTLNSGMRRAQTGFVAVLLADDLWSPDAVEVLARNIAAHPGADFFHSARRFVDERGNPISSVYPAKRSVEIEDFFTASPVKHLMCWRVSKALEFGGMDETLNSVGADDYDFPWLMAEHGARFVPVDECLYVVRDHREFFRLTTHLSLRTHMREHARILRKHGASPELARERVEAARDSYMRQCLYRSPLDRAIKRVTRHDPRSGWRESYR